MSEGYVNSPGSQPHTNLNTILNRGPGAEQDVHASHFSVQPGIFGKQNISEFGKGAAASAEQERYASHFTLDASNPIDPYAVGILRSTILPSVGFHSGVAVIVYVASRATDRVDGKDWVWPTGQVANAWWSSVGARVVYDDISVGTAWSNLLYTEKLLLAGVTAWGVQVFYRIAKRSLIRKRDDPRYDAAKQEEGFWNKALFSIFLPEAVFQAFISLPFTLPFRSISASAEASPLHVHPEYTHGLAVALFSAGFVMETMADLQFAAHQKKHSNSLDREGVWSIVRHPTYLGDILIHTSFPLLLWSAGMMHPLALLGPVANYAFLRYSVVGGDAESGRAKQQGFSKENPAKYAQLQDYKREKNSFWPKTAEIENPWTWAVVGAGVMGLLLEKGFRGYVNRL